MSHDHATKIRRRDVLGMLISFLCLVHCLAAPLLIALVPALGFGFLAVEGIHVAFAVAVLLAAAVALIPGYRQHHRASVLALGASGVFAVALGTTLPAGVPETSVTVVGSCLLIAAHVINLRHSRLHVHSPELVRDN